MKKQLHLILFSIVVLFSTRATAQFTFSDIQFWVGSGSDSTLFVVGFNDATWDSTYVWGFLHNGDATGEDVVNAIVEADVNFSVNITNGFLSDISYGNHAGIGGTDGFYWSTWDGMSIPEMTSNLGLTTPLSSGGVFGCSFTDFNPIVPPGAPIAAFDPFYLTAQDVDFWTGTGSDTTLMVIDFQQGSGNASFVWGYLHNAGTTAETMLNDIVLADANLTVLINSGLLSDLVYNGIAGIGGEPYHWTTWAATNWGTWESTDGLQTELQGSGLFGLSYSNPNAAVRPGYAVPAAMPTHVTMHQPVPAIKVFPNPASHSVNVMLENAPEKAAVQIIDATGKVLHSNTEVSNLFQISIAHLPEGMYTLVLDNNGLRSYQRFIKQ